MVRNDDAKSRITRYKKEKREERPYKFEVFQDVNKEYRFRLKAPNGEIVATSEGYTQKHSCLETIESIKQNASEAVVDTTKRYRMNV